jgi:23S rRNA pseudoU1915 N3-methylase RlmH
MSKTIRKVDLAADEGVLDLRSKERISGGFKINKIEQDSDDSSGPFSEQAQAAPVDPVKHFTTEELNKRMESFAEKLEKAVIKVSPNTSHEAAQQAKEMIKVKFVKFVQLVASRDFVDVLEKNQNEDIILSSNLLTELASAVDQKTSDRKVPVIFIVGLALGVALTYFLISK